MNTFQLECFLAVAETQSFGKAASRLNVTSPAISHQIQSLEEELNVKLFKRTTRSVEITLEGKLFVNDAMSILGTEARAKKRYAHPEEREKQFFVIGCHSQSELNRVSAALHELREMFPNVHPVFKLVPSQLLFQLLEDEEIDIAISLREPAQQKQTLVYKELCQASMSGILPSDHALAQKQSLCTDDLTNERLIISNPMTCPVTISRLQTKLIDSKAAADFYVCDTFDAAITLVQAGYGIAILPDLPIAEELKLVQIPFEGLETLPYGAFYKKDRNKPMLKPFIGMLNRCFGNHQ